MKSSTFNLVLCQLNELSVNTEDNESVLFCYLLAQLNIAHSSSLTVIDGLNNPSFSENYADSEASVSKKDDWSKVKAIFALWDSFFELILNQKKHFQIIMLEHVAESAWSDCKHVNLVEVFDGVLNALIPPPKNDTN